MNTSRFDLTDKIAVVTGGSGVLGGAMARGLLQHGATVVIIGRTQEKIDHTIHDLGRTDAPIEGFRADVLDRDSMIRARDEILKKNGRIDILINAAGGQLPDAVQDPGQSVFDLDFESIRKTIDLNLLGSVYPTLIFGKKILETGTGSIINISSMASDRAVTRVMAYSLAKSAIESFTKWMSMELGAIKGDKVRINAIAPGFFISDQNREILTEKDGSLTDRAKKIIAHTPAGRLGEPKELISTAVWLCSDESRFVNGAIIPVDGGFSKFSGV